MRSKTTRNTIATSHTQSKHSSHCNRNSIISYMNLCSVQKKPKAIINTSTKQSGSLNTHILYKTKLNSLHKEINTLQVNLAKQKQLISNITKEKNRLISENKSLKMSINIYKNKLRYLQREFDTTKNIRNFSNRKSNSAYQGDYLNNIDNMSYEQLLELEDQIGYVSKGLSKEEIQHKINKIEYVNNTINNREQCTICQEAFNENDFIDELKCKHCFHDDCIIKWLELNKQCPSCKCEI